jgi:hypothetical protein
MASPESNAGGGLFRPPFKVGGSYALRPGFAMEGRRSIPDRGSNDKKV